MRIGRIATADGTVHARREGDGWIGIEDPYAAFAAGRVPGDLGAVEGEVLAPCAPEVVLGIAQNGPGHASPVQAWLKSPRTVVSSGTPVHLRRDAGTTVAEGEIAVVIGRPTHGLTAGNAHEYVLGLTAVNDLSSPDRTALDPRNFESKSGTGYTPLGPWLDTDLDLDDVGLVLEVDGTTVADTGARQLPVPIRDCLAYVCGWSTLGPGDVVMTGAPYSQAEVGPGQEAVVIVGGIRLSTPLR
ncbi:fumarylacetoacetate hydrolase family protein [Microbacterium sp. 22242]|uniref:fumarylacetoacetate hydrolase family protein n=1 Tax=Microbacterium sp. 22242 TaxID=3453896 RepID=UPI003F82A6B1